MVLELLLIVSSHVHLPAHAPGTAFDEGIGQGFGGFGCSAENPKPVISVAKNAEVNPMCYPNVSGIDLGWRSAEMDGDVNHRRPPGIRCPHV
jgi:hypothetical protein